MKTLKICSICEEEFESLDRIYYCPVCYKSYKQQYYKKNKKKISQKFIAIETPAEKECSCCQQLLSSSQFARDKTKKSGLSSWCKRCKNNKKKKD